MHEPLLFPQLAWRVVFTASWSFKQDSRTVCTFCYSWLVHIEKSHRPASLCDIGLCGFGDKGWGHIDSLRLYMEFELGLVVQTCKPSYLGG